MVSKLVTVTSVEPMPQHRLKVACSDGARGVFDMSPFMKQPVYRALSDPDEFNRVFIAFGVPTWPNGADIAAERVRSDMVES
ncbi:DUF2442 domain-containing protein [Bifidobacterium vespertilionis]|uniref:DUF2442 domain-containing protein n=1 Tax=Bifidobacterium vespertilionis TaxID=2562524 RepID=A0A5J5E4I5_9BIFI|nr:DUF2442 domain-containing protein [Bifidobacterium vespertilionis]KAA8822637.1 DUF2442 domain-containing protein [Bifidobacterium vespertilionis]KAA8824078.1 DUF2442 domain-containing protein [Bifidobacterium vespertilionis]MBT1179189.1 DUF2442 domain-containing protein [Bifidobacterium vespertilionis]